MRYKVLVTGKNDSAITAFFEQISDDFVILSTSTRYEDIVGHIDYFVPHVFVYCLHNEARDSIVQMLSINSRLLRSKIPCVILGSKEECDEFERIAVNVASLVLHRPLSATAIKKKILDFMEKNKTGREEEEDFLPGQAELPEQEAAVLDAGGAGAEDIEPLPRKKHVLVVDDNPMMLKVIKEHLHEDYDVATAVSGRVALKFLERRTTDLILLDYLMPEESGLEVLEKLRAKEETKDIPVIFLTGVTERKKIKNALVMRPQGYLLKPVDHDKLMEEIAKYIG
ncbi:MAG: response regulator [Lachnospiraceae bacterium]|nr:response regulator [Lachnospiraceae bacterium]